jgi:hypothetical protein
MSIILLATQEAEIRRIKAPNQCRQTVFKTHHKKGMVEWLKV